jgi:hypothetical protein
MTPQEHQALQSLLSQLTQIRGVTKDPQAESMIADAVATQPDAAYLLVQRAMILEQALEAAKARIAELERQSQSVAQSGNFLDANAWGNAGGARQVGSSAERSVTGAELPANPVSGNPPPYYPNQARAASPGPFGGAGSMLGTVAATAAGVAGGAFLYQGIGNLLGSLHHQSDAARLADNEMASSHAAWNEPAVPDPDTALRNIGSGDNAQSDDLFASGDDDLFGGDDGSDDGSYDI